MNILENLLIEQTKAGNIANTRPYLVQLQKTVASRVFRDMVAIQETDNPVAQVFGLKYLTDTNKQLHNNQLTITGATQKEDVSTLPELTQGMTVQKGKLYKSQDNEQIYISSKQTTLVTETDFDLLVLRQIVNGDIRLYTDAADVNYSEGQIPRESKFEIGKWVQHCKTRKISVKITQELIQDLEQNNLDSVAIVEDMLQSAIVNEVNKDIISKLITVSQRYNNSKLKIENGFVDLSKRQDQYWQIGRDINAMIGAAAADMLQNTTYSATYVIVQPNIYGLLCGAGLVVFNEEQQMTRSHGYLKSGLKIYIDTYQKFDYFVVECKHNISLADNHEVVQNEPQNQDEAVEYYPDDLIGQLYYCPYLEEDGSQMYITRDSESLQNNILLQTRYALSVNPFVTDGVKNNIGDDWDNLAGKQKLSILVGIKL